MTTNNETDETEAETEGDDLEERLARVEQNMATLIRIIGSDFMMKSIQPNNTGGAMARNLIGRRHGTDLIELLVALRGPDLEPGAPAEAKFIARVFGQMIDGLKKSVADIERRIDIEYETAFGKRPT